MSTFQKPSTGSSSKKGDNMIEFSSYVLDNIYSPFDGKVTNLSNSRCGGNIEIKHNFRGQNIYSNFCGVSTIYVSRGDTVNTGQKIGMFGSSPIEYSINDGISNLNPRNFFDVSDTEQIRNKEKKTSREELKPLDLSNQPNKEVFGKFVKTKGLSAGQQVMVDLLGSPLRAMKNTPFFKPGKFFQKSKKTNESVDFENRLLEEIQKIKSLLK